MSTLGPRLEIADCHFAHIEPWLNPEQLADLWFYEGPPVGTERLPRIFGAVPHRVIFAGHYHRWLLAGPERITDWRGDGAVKLDSGRHFVVVGAVCEGRFAVFDTETSELIPFNTRPVRR